MNSLTDTASIFRYHREMIAHYGNNNSHALGWRDDQSQLIRFQVLSQIGDLNHHSVMDVGCGHADLCPYLKAIYPDCRYLGVEQIPELLDRAIERYGHLPETLLFLGDFLTSPLPAADYVLASGSLNYSSSDPEFIYKAISKLFESSRVGFGFNLLRSVSQTGLLKAYNLDTIWAYCQELTTKAVLKDDYSEEDFTIFLYH
ncbi:class I SAM-dependent methyltransferase [Mucilaginibacter sp. RS28]|uniref:Class I SAM-dependent methyltransferase n=1 Tax=Mucilaginibacter straminoryzae TaxID=2932774 RepID=A0A9X1WZ50_9SPHI|nr:class I SAM-dependent methyltransferase [Mucilaginibacter straminoryzae]MCJ8208317.1 class I SAM-dependent methyltransferase [Mucilaginibacter straminoryzae]